MNVSITIELAAGQLLDGFEFSLPEPKPEDCTEQDLDKYSWLLSDETDKPTDDEREQIAEFKRMDDFLTVVRQYCQARGIEFTDPYRPNT